jgi:hypothetical protein
MRRISLFAEDQFHELFLQAVISRLATEFGVAARVRLYSVRGGLPKMHHELGVFLRDLHNDKEELPDAVLAATDANCAGYVERRQILANVVQKYPQIENLMIYAIPDPHIERWMMMDPGAFRAVFSRGCTLPARKCERGLYKKLLSEEILESGIRSLLGGREYAEDIVSAMDLPRAGQNEASFGRLLGDLRAFFLRWRNTE